MKKSELDALINGQILDDEVALSFAELCNVCRLPAERVVEMVEYGIVEPSGSDQRHWRFESISIRRVGRAQRLQQDLGINVAGVALALDLLDEVDRLHSRLRRLEREN